MKRELVPGDPYFQLRVLVVKLHVIRVRPHVNPQLWHLSGKNPGNTTRMIRRRTAKRRLVRNAISEDCAWCRRTGMCAGLTGWLHTGVERSADRGPGFGRRTALLKPDTRIPGSTNHTSRCPLDFGRRSSPAGVDEQWRCQ